MLFRQLNDLFSIFANDPHQKLLKQSFAHNCLIYYNTIHGIFEHKILKLYISFVCTWIQCNNHGRNQSFVLRFNYSTNSKKRKIILHKEIKEHSEIRVPNNAINLYQILFQVTGCHTGF